jgi:hypothetical protein
MVVVIPVSSSRRTTVQSPSRRSAETQRVRGAMVAPSSAAAMALSTTSRESSTQQSEYSKPRLNSGLSGAPSGSRVRSTTRVLGSFLRPPILS